MANVNVQEIIHKFGALFNRISMYPPTHPSFQKTIDDFYQYLQNVKQQTPFLDIYATPQSVIINGEELKGSRNFSLGFYLHRRGIESLHLGLENLTKEEIKVLATALSAAPKEIIAEGGLRRILGRSDIKNIDIKELNYQHYLSGEGEEIESFWDFFSDRVKRKAWEEVGKEEIDYLLQEKGNFLEKKLATFDSHSLSIFLEHMREYLQRKFPDKINTFAQIIFRAFLKRDFNDEEATNWNKAVRILEYIDENNLEESFFEFISTDRMANVEILKKMAFLTKERSNQLIFSSHSRQALQKLDEHSLEAFQAATKELLSNTAMEKFLSDSYRKFLQTATEYIEEIRNINTEHELKPAQINHDYLYMLLDILELEPEITQPIAEELKREFVRVMKEKNTKELADILKTTKSFLHKARSAGINDLLRYICEVKKDLLDELLNFSRNGKEAVSLTTEIFLYNDNSLDYLWAKLLDNPNLIYNSAYKHFLSFSSPLLISRNSQRLLDIKPHVLWVKEYLNFLSCLSLEKNKDTLLRICSIYRHNSFILTKAVKILADKGFSDKKFFRQFLYSKDTTLREASLLVLRKVDRANLNSYIKGLISPFNPLGLRNNFVRENLEIIGRNDIKEATGLLQKLLQHPPLSMFLNKSLYGKAKKVWEILQR